MGWCYFKGFYLGSKRAIHQTSSTKRSAKRCSKLKLADARKEAQACFGDIVCGPEMVMKNVRDIQGLALAIVLERLKTHGAFPEVHENTRTIPAGKPSKTGSNIGKPNGHASRHGSTYQARIGLMTAGSYGLPQFRMRMFMWGTRPNESNTVVHDDVKGFPRRKRRLLMFQYFC